ncbi:MAG: Protein transport protein Sec23A [Paramarteilia canceri]
MIPAELQKTSATIDYVCPSNHSPPIFLFLVDVSVNQEDLEFIKQNILLVMNTISDKSLVGLITFGNIVKLHEISEMYGFFKSNGFSGGKIMMIENQILSHPNDQNLSETGAGQQIKSNQFFKLYSKCDLEFGYLVKSLLADSNKGNHELRPKRCAGTALNFAVSLLEILYPNTSSKIVTFLGGPITYGPGAIASEIKSKHLRQYLDIRKGSASLTTSALQVIY